MDSRLVFFTVITVLAGIYISYYGYRLPQLLNNVRGYDTKKGSLLSPEELLQYNGINQPELYLAILGSVFNVTKAAKHYGPGETYNVFVGRDASRSFVTGQFEGSDVSDDITGLSNADLLSLKNWLKFYKENYPKVGKLIGRFYDKDGKPTAYYREFKKLMKQAEAEKGNEELEKLKFPPCNIEWNMELGSRVWCTKRSGGVERSWIGVPRKLYEPGSNSHRCACVSEENRNLGNVREYEGCDPNLDSCFVNN